MRIYENFLLPLQTKSIIMKQFFLTIFALLTVLNAFAQFKPGTERPLQTESTDPSEEWFDPTRKKEKVQEMYEFATDWRIEAGYVQNNQRSLSQNIMNPFLHGIKLGATVDFRLPYHFSLQTGLHYTLTYGQIEQHWSATTLEMQHIDGDYIRHGIMEHQLGVPIRAYYTIPLWKQLNMFFFTGPKMEIGLAQTDFLKLHLSEDFDNMQGSLQWLQQNGYPTDTYDRYTNGALRRFNIQYGLGGGFEWDRYRIVAGYDFGLNNLVKTPKVKGQHMWEWGWFCSFSYKL